MVDGGGSIQSKSKRGVKEEHKIVALLQFPVSDYPTDPLIEDFDVQLYG